MQSTVAAMYAALFNRAPEKAGLDFWCGQLDSGVSLAAMAQTMYETAPARATYPDGISNADVVKAFYLNVLGRAGDAEGLAFWEARLNTLGTKGALIAEMVANVQGYTGTDPAGVTSKALFDNKCAVGVTYAVTLGKQDIELAKAVLALVTATDKTAAEHAANVGQTFTLTTGTDTLVGTSGNDTFIGAKTTFAAADDKIVDISTTDADELNLTFDNDVTAMNVTNVEKINVTVASTAAKTVTATGVSGAKELHVYRANVTVGDASIAGDKTITVAGYDSSKIAKVYAHGGTDVTVSQVNKAGGAVNADEATGNIVVNGAVTLNAAVTTGTVNVNGLAVANATEDAKAVTVNAAKAASVTTAVALTGAITINAAEATAVTVNNAKGGVTIDAAKAATTGITVVDIDASGATIKTGAYTKTAAGTIAIDGTTATDDAASVSAAGYVNLDVDGAGTEAVEKLTLSGNGAEVFYTLATPATAITSITGSGDQKVNVEAQAAAVSGKVVTGLNTLTINNIGAAVDLSKVSVTATELTADAVANTVTVANGSRTVISKDQTGLNVIFATKDDAITLAAGDDNGTSTAVPEITLGALDLDGGAVAGTVTLEAETGKLTATGVSATDIALVVKGSKDVTLGTVAAKSVDAAALTGKLSLTAGANLKTVTSGSGVDTITVDGAAVHTVSAGAGNDIINITNTDATAQFDGGAGNDTFTVLDDAAIVVVGGEGDDKVTVGNSTTDVVTDAILSAGNGTDTLAFDSNTGAALDLSGTTNFAFTGFEVVDLTDLDNTLTISAKQFANNATFALKGTANDTLVIKAAATGSTIDLSGLTLSSGSAANINVVTGAKADTVTGSANNDVIFTSGGADVIDGAAGTDTINLAGMVTVTETGSGVSVGTVINLGATAVSGTSVFAATGNYVSGSATSVAAGTAAYTFAADATTNSTVVKTISNVENITGSNGKDYIVGSVGDNVITGGAGVDYVVGGDGADTFVFATADIDTTAGAVTDVVADFNASIGDKINVGVAGAVATYAEAGAAVADLATLLTAADTALNGTVQIYVGQVTGGAAYVVTDTDGNGYTDVIQLTGVTLATIDAAAFIV